MLLYTACFVVVGSWLVLFFFNEFVVVAGELAGDVDRTIRGWHAGE